MKLSQIVLVVAVVMMAAYLLRNRRDSRAKAYKKLALITFLIISIVTILFPGLLTGLANFMGIGRGADLLVYVVAIAVLFQMINNYIKDKEDKSTLNQLARKVAILEANISNKDKS